VLDENKLAELTVHSSVEDQKHTSVLDVYVESFFKPWLSLIFKISFLTAYSAVRLVLHVVQFITLLSFCQFVISFSWKSLDVLIHFDSMLMER